MRIVLDLRKRVMVHLEAGHTHQETAHLFKLSLRTLTNWCKLQKETDFLAVKNTPRSPHKLPDKELLEYVKKHPDAYVKEIAFYLGCGVTTVYDALKRNDVTYKKNRRYIVKETRKVYQICKYYAKEALGFC